CAFLALTRLHEHDLFADVSSGNARHAPALVRWRTGLECRRRKSLGFERISVERAYLDRRLGHGLGSDTVYHQFLLEHKAREESERQSLGGNHSGMDSAFTAAAWELCHNADGLSRTLRI